VYTIYNLCHYYTGSLHAVLMYLCVMYFRKRAHACFSYLCTCVVLCCLGSHLMPAEIPPEHPDILIVESTYGTMNHSSREERESRFTSTVEGIVNRGGNCLIPVFALGRAQVNRRTCSHIILTKRLSTLGTSSDLG
jgi:hypothetical protein